MVALLQAGHARADVDDDAGTLVAQDRGEEAFRVVAREGEPVGVAQSPVALISTSTSPALGPSSWTVSIDRGLPGARATAARTSMGGSPGGVRL